ncbi:hypothetical protein PD280_06015 [Virgibacillus salarius]|uniref:hypothetical protein n=1 Tax=Virgibacillus salarius TaxID=447199 RepID=UPI0024923F68|nr:hypothetical protein [Virgibacillus salarius]WBX81275.1 hypothetical protein PD280_06015 [Virgibacillus salarius]
MPKANINQINAALSKIKDTINDAKYGGFHFKRRPETEETMIKLGYKHEHVLEEILSLTYRNYCDGPEQNRSNSGVGKGSIWKFGKFIESIEVYIKIHIVPQGAKNQCICISFHEANYSMAYPYAS